MSERVCEQAHDLDVVLRVARRVDRLAHPLNAALTARDRPFTLSPGGGSREHNVGEFGGLGQEQILDHEMIQTFQKLYRVSHVRFRLRRIFADDVEAREIPALHCFEHEREVPPVLVRKLRAPRLLELRSMLGVLDILESRKLVRNRAHVAATLDVVLSTEWNDTRAPSADVAGQEREVDEREDVVGGGVMFGNPEGPTDLRAIGFRVRMRHFPNTLARQGRDLLGVFEGVRLDRCFVCLEVRRRIIDERAILESRGEDLAADGVGECDVGARVETEPKVGPLRGRCAAGIDREELGSVSDTFQEVVKENRVGIAGVRAPKDDDIRLFDLLVGARPTACSEDVRQTGDARSVSRAVTAIDVVASHDDACELLCHEVHLVRRLGAAEQTEGRALVLFEAACRALERFVPARGAERAPVAHHRLRQSFVAFSHDIYLSLRILSRRMEHAF